MSARLSWSSILVPLVAALLVGPLAVPAAGQGYQLPDPAVVELLEAPPPPSLRYAPGGALAAVVERAAMPPLADLARPMLRLAGLRIDPACDARYATSFDRRLGVLRLADLDSREVPLPEGARLSGTRWSHDGRQLAFTLATDGGTQLWVVDAAALFEGDLRPRLLHPRLHTVLGGWSWTPDGRGLLALTVPEGRGPAPEPSPVPAGPRIQESGGTSTPLRTYQDLLASEHDAALFRHHATSVVTLIDVASGDARMIGPPAVHMGASLSPDGRQLLVTRLHEPYSFTAPYDQFARTTEVRGLDGTVQHVVADLPVDAGVPIGGVHTGRRRIAWRAGAPATLVWVEALDGGDPEREVEHRDRWFAQAAPFDDEPRELLRVEHRASGLSWTEDPDLVLSREYDRDERWIRTTVHDLSGERAPVVLEDRSIRDRYGNPGSAVSTRDASGRSVVRLDGGRWLYRTGSGASPEGLLPFLDRQDVTSGASERLWRCRPGEYARVAELLDDGRFVAVHETTTSPPNHVLHGADGSIERALTRFADPQPALRGVHKELVTYTRADGVPLSATLYLPPGHQPGDTHPMLIWAYPREFNDVATAGQVGVSPDRFTTVRGSSHLALLLQGYAVLDGATMPIIGDAETMNDAFIEQLVSSAEAAIAYVVDERGVTERGRIAVGGHSYGAFMTANLLAHSDLFAAGIARSGAYNRTLTPFGFQSERRTVWEATDSYVAISPFLHADTIDEPMLMIHGEVDNNSGTFPLQSERMYSALKGNGGTARLVMLPHESHGYRARESVLHVQHEMAAWLDQHLADDAE